MKVALEVEIEDVDIAILALLRFAGCERQNQDEKCERAIFTAREWSKALNEIEYDRLRPVLPSERKRPDRQKQLHR